MAIAQSPGSAQASTNCAVEFEQLKSCAFENIAVDTQNNKTALVFIVA